MNELLLALRRSVASLGRGRIWVYIIAPGVLAAVFMGGVSYAFLDHLVRWAVSVPPLSWVSQTGVAWLADGAALVGGWMVVLSASYLVATLVTAIVVVPLMLNELAATDYADLARQGEERLIASTWNSVWSAVLFVCGWLLSLPFWLIPGFGLFLPLFWMAWLNRRTFAYDVLVAHATPGEWRTLRSDRSGSLLAIGLVTGAMTHVPFLGLLAPSLAALSYIHYCLEALRRARRGASVGG